MVAYTPEKSGHRRVIKEINDFAPILATETSWRAKGYIVRPTGSKENPTNLLQGMIVSFYRLLASPQPLLTSVGGGEFIATSTAVC